MNSDHVTTSVYVEVEPQRAFEIFTEDVDLWWKHGPAYRFGGVNEGTLRFEPGIGGRLVETMKDESEWEVGRITVWEPGARLVFGYRIPNFRAGESTEVEVLFEPAGEGTQVTLTHRGWESVPKGHPARHGASVEEHQRQRGQWWLDQLRSYRQRQ